MPLAAPASLLVALALGLDAEEATPPAAPPVAVTAAPLVVGGVEFAPLAGSAPLSSITVSAIDSYDVGGDQLTPPDGGGLFDVGFGAVDARLFLWQGTGEPLDPSVSYARTVLGAPQTPTSHGVVLATAEGVARLELAVIAPPRDDAARDALAVFARAAIARELSERQRSDLIPLLRALGERNGREFIAWLWTASGEGDAETRAAAAAAAYQLGGGHPERLAELASDAEVGVAMACAAAELAPPPADARAWVLAALARDGLADDDASRLLTALAKLDAAQARRVALDWLAHGDAARASAAIGVVSSAATPDPEAGAAVLARIQRGAHPAADAGADDAADDDRVALLEGLEKLDPMSTRSVAAEWWRQPMTWEERRAALDALVRLKAIDAGIVALVETALAGDDGLDPSARELLPELGKLDPEAERRVALGWLGPGGDAGRAAAAAAELAGRGTADPEAAKLVQACIAALGSVAEARDDETSDDPGAPLIAALATLDPSAARPLALQWLREARPPLAVAAAEALMVGKAEGARDADAASAIAQRVAALGDHDDERGRLLAILAKLDGAGHRRALLALLRGDDAGAQEQAARCLADAGKADAEATDALVAAVSASAELDEHATALLAQLERLDHDAAARVRKAKGW